MNKADIKLIGSLHLKKYRKEHGLFIAEGKKIVDELVNSPITVREIYLTDEWDQPAEPFAVKVTRVTAQEMRKMSTQTTPQGIIALCVLPPSPRALPDFRGNLVLALDNLRDPGNIGTIIRIAHWFGIKDILCSSTCTDVFGPKAVQASMGSVASVAIHTGDLTAMVMQAAQEAPVYGAVLGGASVYSEKLTGKGVLVIGSESHGLSPELKGCITHPLAIPAYNANGPESLNAAAATAILCSEFRRRG